MKISKSTAILASLLLAGVLGACSDDDGGSGSAGKGGTSNAGGSNAGGSNAGGSNAGGSTNNGGSTGTAELGPECQAYAECCVELASAQPTMGTQCDQAIESMKASLAQNPSSKDTLESSCKQALAAVQSGGYCK